MENRLPSGDYCRFDVIAVAASLGGPAALSRILELLPADFPAAVLVAQHLSEKSAPIIIRHLAQHSALPISEASSGAQILPGRAYIAPPDQHLTVTADRRLQLARTPRVKFCRPAAEPLFASVAGTYRERALGVVLTGCNTDGAIGSQTIKWMGGCVMAQDPLQARAPGMPRAAIATGAVDYVVPLDKIPAALVALVMVRGVAEYLRVSPTAA